jgi:hypothetical protein
VWAIQLRPQPQQQQQHHHQRRRRIQRLQ